MIYAGIDEANKGQVLGPIFVVMAYTSYKIDAIPKIKDSKRITTKELTLLDDLLSRYNIRFMIEEVSIQELDKSNINLLIRNSMVKLIKKVSPDITYVDSHYSNSLKLQTELRELTENQVHASVKADESNSLVAIASLIAYREKLLYFKKARLKYGETGSGNLADKLTINYIKNSYPNTPLLRKKWSLKSIFGNG